MACRLVLCLLTLLPFAASAQNNDAPERTALFAYFSYNTVLQQMKGMDEVEKNIASLRAQYDAEMKRAEEEFNTKYEEFLENQRSLAPSIYKKRQAELTDMMQKNIACWYAVRYWNIAFKAEANRLLEQARKDAMAPLKQKVVTAVRNIGKQHGYAFILNSDNNTLTYADPTLGDDITQEILKAVE